MTEYKKELKEDYKSCKICGFSNFTTIYGLQRHLEKKHKVSTRHYYDSFFKKEGEGICGLSGCEKETKFISVIKGYNLCCCKSHANGHPISIEKHKLSKLEKYGDSNYGNFGSESHKRIMLEKYGEDNIFKTEQFKKDIKERVKEIDLLKKKTCLLNYGETHYMKTKEGKLNFTSKKDEMRKNYIETCQKRYGVNFYIQLVEENIERYKKNQETWKNKTEEELNTINKNRRKTKEDRGIWVAEEFLSDWVLYSKRVRYLTSKRKEELFKNWDGLDFYTKDDIKENLEKYKYTSRYYPTIDHKISVFEGFRENLSIGLVSDINNLCITKRFLNSSKYTSTLISFIKKLKNKKEFFYEL